MQDVRLMTLLCVAEQKNFTRAAQVLALTQPAVSQHVSSLESELGVKLVLRGKGEVKLTPEGEIVCSYARRINAMYDKMIAELGDPSATVTKLKIGITHTAENNRIPQVLARYSSLLGKPSITIVTDTIKNLYTLLENYELDMAIVEGKDAREGMRRLMLDTDYLVCVVSPESALARRSMITLADLKRERMIMRLPSSATRALFDSTLESLGENIADFDIILEVDNISTIKDLVKRDLGVSILPRSTCDSEIRKGKLVALPIENLSMARETNIVYNKDFSHPEVLEDIVKMYRETTERR